MSIPIPEKRIARFEELGFGMFIHWGLYSQIGKGEWIQYLGKIPKEEYIKLKDTFTAKDFSGREIAKTAKRAGMKYITLTTRHHEGFSLYDTRGLNDYDAPHSPAARDLIADFVEGCRAEGILPMFYHTTLDWYNEDFNSDFKKYCYSADHYDDSDMTFIISDREKWYLVVRANKGGSGVMCGIWDNICNYRMDIRSTPYDDIVDNIHGWTYKDAVAISPVAGKISIDDVIRIHNEKGEDLDSSDFAGFTYEDFKLNGSHIVKYRVVDGEKYKVSKVNEVYLTLLLGNGRPLISASLHDQNFIYNSQLINIPDSNDSVGTFINSIDSELADTKFGAWFLDNQ